MPRSRQFLPALGLGLLTAGCISTSVRHLDEAPRPERPPHAVAVLSERPDAPHTVLAVVSARSPAVFDSFDDLRARLVAVAASLGGDAVILGPTSRRANPVFNTAGFVMSEEKALSGEVIAFRPR